MCRRDYWPGDSLAYDITVRRTKDSQSQKTMDVFTTRSHIRM